MIRRRMQINSHLDEFIFTDMRTMLVSNISDKEYFDFDGDSIMENLLGHKIRPNNLRYLVRHVRDSILFVKAELLR
jgi:hypothetical protein